MKLLVIDNYDSFTYNLVQYLGELGASSDVVRNDAIPVEEVGRRGADIRQDFRSRPMTKSEFLDTLRRRPAGMPQSDIDDVIADYAIRFADGMAPGRSEAETAQSLGDPMRRARELRAEAPVRAAT